MPKLSRDGVNIHYEVHGSGPPLLLTHGYSSTSAMWQGQVAALSRQHKLVLWDMRGHGQVDYPSDPAAYSEALTVADMAALLDEVIAGTAIVGGLSLGGYMSLAFHRAPAPSRRLTPGARRPLPPDPARRPRDRVAAQYQGALAGRGRRRRHTVSCRLRLHGRKNSRRAEGRDPRRRPRRQHRSAAGLCRCGAAVP